MKTTKNNPDARGRLDIALYRVCERVIDERVQNPVLAQFLKGHAETFISENVPAKSILPKPPRRRLCS
jgi:hypothetical protein